MRLYVDVWADSVGSKDDFWKVVEEATKAIAAVDGEHWKITEVGLQTNRTYYTGASNDHDS